MSTYTNTKDPDIIVKNGKPQAVILDIKEYEKLLESAEESNDLSEFRKIKKSKPSFKSLDSYLATRRL